MVGANVSRLHEAGLVVDRGDNPRLTVAGALSMTKEPSAVLGKAYVEIFRFRAGASSYAQSGERAGSSYSLARELGPPRGLELDPIELRSSILSIAKEAGRVTNEDVRRRTGLERAPVLAVLSALVRSGELARHGERRGSYYTVVQHNLDRR